MGFLGGVVGAVASTLSGIGGAPGAFIGSKFGNEDPGNPYRTRLLKDEYGYSDQDIADFSTMQGVNQSDLNALNSGWGQFDKTSGKPMSYFDSKDASKDIGPVVEKFLAWKKRRDQSKLDQEAYAKTAKESPGRSQTILVEPSPQGQTVIA